MMTPTEKRLKDYMGYQVWKCTDEDGEIYYMLCDKEGNDAINVYTTLEALKKDVREVWA